MAEEMSPANTEFEEECLGSGSKPDVSKRGDEFDGPELGRTTFKWAILSGKRIPGQRGKES